jgi:Ca2+-dependent lipid-binding protein
MDDKVGMTRKVVSSLLKPRKKGEASKMILRVSINKAEHLPGMDLSGLSDPFVKLHYDGKMQKTNVIRESLDPEWNESFDFEYKVKKECILRVWFSFSSKHRPI